METNDLSNKLVLSPLKLFEINHNIYSLRRAQNYMLIKSLINLISVDNSGLSRVNIFIRT